MMTVEFGCPHCGRAVDIEPGHTETCAACGGEVALRDATENLAECLACACPEVYRHRDFNQKVGILLIVGGAILCFWFPYWPLALAAVLDLVLFKTLPDVAICYRCKAHHRGFHNVKVLPKFDLERHEHYRYEKARAEGRVE